MNLNIIEERLRRDNFLPEDFRFYRYECFPHGAPTLYTEIEGGRCPLVLTGKRKGLPNWNKRTECRVFYVSEVDGEKWMAEYESETGNCRGCCGSGLSEVYADVVAHGKMYRDCVKCGGRGKVENPPSIDKRGFTFPNVTSTVTCIPVANGDFKPAERT